MDIVLVSLFFAGTILAIIFLKLLFISDRNEWGYDWVEFFFSTLSVSIVLVFASAIIKAYNVINPGFMTLTVFASLSISVAVAAIIMEFLRSKLSMWAAEGVEDHERFFAIIAVISSMASYGSTLF